MILTALVFLLLLSVLVLIHEAGHYFTAKKFGIKVEEFGFGLPPRLWGKKMGETIYSLNWLPIGGFVKLYGEDDAGAGRIGVVKDKQHEDTTHKDPVHRAFFSRPAWQRACVVVAGVIMNTILAIVIYYVFLFVSNFHTALPLLANYHFFGANQTNVIAVTEVSKDSPAAQAGISTSSEIISVNGEKIADISMFLRFIKSNVGKAVYLEWQDVKTGEKKAGVVVPRVHPPKGQGALGIAYLPVATVVLSYDTPVQKIFSGISHPTNLMVYQLVVLKSLVVDAFKEKTVVKLSESVSGPVGIFQVVGVIVHIPEVRERFLQILNLAGILSISLAFFNVLPIPGLDGGRLFFIVVEMLTGYKADEKVEGYTHAVGMALLIALILLVTIKDVLQLFK